MLTEAGRIIPSYARSVSGAKDGTQRCKLGGDDRGAVTLAIVGTLAGTTVVESCGASPLAQKCAP